MSQLSRRNVLTGIAALAVSGSTSHVAQADEGGTDEEIRSIATNTYPWLTFARRDGRDFEIHSERLLGDIASTGIVGYEPICTRVEEFDGLREVLGRHGLSMPSIYVNSVLHDAKEIDQTIENVLRVSRAAQDLGAKIVVTNPSPIRWGGTEDKSDAQLRLQAESLDRLGRELRAQGLTLAYHNHDAELRQGGREFHHMLTATDPDNVKLCLDAHWIYRGCGNSEVAVFDALAHYSSRVVELHLRQSKGGIWTEAFQMQGDLDYRRLFQRLAEKGVQPHLVLEQAVEARSPKNQTAVEAHTLSRNNLFQAIRS